MQKLISLILILLIPVACTHNRITQEELQFANDIDIQLLSPASFGENISLSQSIEFQYKGKMRELLVQSEFSKEKVVVVGLTTTGTRLFSIIYDGVDLEIEEYSEIKENLQPRYMLADMQLSLWPFDIIEQHLNTTSRCFKNLQCKFIESEDKLKRTLVKNGEIISLIRYHSTPHYADRIEFINKLRNYQLSIIPLVEVEVLNGKRQ